MPGLPSEMEAMFASVEEEFRRGSPIGAWRRTYRTRESVIAPVLVEFGERWPGAARRLVSDVRCRTARRSRWW